MTPLDEDYPFFPKSKVSQVLAQNEEPCYHEKVCYYDDLFEMARVICSSRYWTQGEVFVHATSKSDFLIAKQIAPSSCEIMLINQNGLHDVVSAHRMGEKDFHALLVDLTTPVKMQFSISSLAKEAAALLTPKPTELKRVSHSFN